MSWVSLAVGAGTAAYQIIGGAIKKKKEQKAFEEMSKKQPKFEGSPELDQYYQQNLQQAMTPAQDSALYKQQQQQIGRSMAQGLAGSNVARGGQSLVSKLTQGATDASMRATAAAEQQKEQRMARLGSIVGMKAAEGQRKFDINQMKPWELQTNILGAKAAGAAQQERAGWQNLSNLAMGGAQLAAYKSMYGKNGGGDNNQYETGGNLGTDESGNPMTYRKGYGKPGILNY
jgi:hypothetical protein